ncbi:MAG TPA: TonB-dependent receptor, partial [Porphyromonadaceae bacterium]|nr:TonB-dependent receptor [Porphyromonadaceae bacterium]
QMSAINDLNAGAVYDILPSLSIHLKANNLLFQKYDRWHGYAAQGLNVLGGFTFTF